MSWDQVQKCFAGVHQHLDAGGWFCLYGPFKYKGAFTSHGNAEFDQHLKAGDSRRGIRDFEALQQLAEAVGFSLINDYDLPANNRLLVWKKL